MIQLDTSFLIRSLVGGSAEDSALRRFIRAREPLGISSIAWAEFSCGPLNESAVNVARGLVGEPFPFAGTEAEVAARLFNSTGRRRGSMMDCMVAATAIEAGDRLATSNRKDFDPFVEFGLVIAG